MRTAEAQNRRRVRGKSPRRSARRYTGERAWTPCIPDNAFTAIATSPCKCSTGTKPSARKDTFVRTPKPRGVRVESLCGRSRGRMDGPVVSPVVSAASAAKRAAATTWSSSRGASVRLRMRAPSCTQTQAQRSASDMLRARRECAHVLEGEKSALQTVAERLRLRTFDADSVHSGWSKHLVK